MKTSILHSAPQALLGVLFMFLIAAFSMGEEQKEALIKKVQISGLISRNLPFTLCLEAVEIGADEIERRASKMPIYGGNATKTNPIQLAVTCCQLTISNRVFSVPKEALEDLLDPGFVYTVHVKSEGDRIVIAWAGGSGERGYICEFHATRYRFNKRQIRQLDNQRCSIVTTKKL